MTQPTLDQLAELDRRVQLLEAALAPAARAKADPTSEWYDPPITPDTPGVALGIPPGKR